MLINTLGNNLLKVHVIKTTSEPSRNNHTNFYYVPSGTNGYFSPTRPQMAEIHQRILSPLEKSKGFHEEKSPHARYYLYLSTSTKQHIYWLYLQLFFILPTRCAHPKAPISPYRSTPKKISITIELPVNQSKEMGVSKNIHAKTKSQAL